MVAPHRWHGQAPRASLLNPVWEPTTCGGPSDEAWVARCLLGAGWIGGSRRLSMLDLRVWAALCAQLREQLPEPPAGDPTLANADTRTVETTAYQLAERVFARGEGGNRWARLREALMRLRSATVLVQTVERDPEIAAQMVRSGAVALIGDVWLATLRLDLTTPREWGALKGSTTLKVEIGRWPAQQLLADRVTWLDLDLLRKLGNGLPARLWVALEAWARWPQRSLDGREQTAIGLGQPALESLGVAQYQRRHDARRALDRAGARIVAVDPAYELIRCQGRGQVWNLVVRRLRGQRARARARSGATWRSQGIAASKRQRAERTAVRAKARKSLADAADAAS